MKRFTLLIALAIISLANLFSQTCLPAGITLTTQAQIDSFQINYPGCTEIEGDVEITGDDITSLNGLSVLTSIGGDLQIDSNAVLTSLTGLDNTASIGGNCQARLTPVHPPILPGSQFFNNGPPGVFTCVCF